MSISTPSKINRLLIDAVPGGLLFAAWLRKEGYSAQLLKKYRVSGWLEDGQPSALAAVYSYNHQTGKIARIAAHSALELLGFNHYVSMGKPRLMVAFASGHFDDWVRSDKYDMTILPFHTSIFKNPTTQFLAKNG